VILAKRLRRGARPGREDRHARDHDPAGGSAPSPRVTPLHLGMPGMHGEVHVNRAIQRGPTSIVGIGLRFDDRVTGKPSRALRAAGRAKSCTSIWTARRSAATSRVAVGLIGDAKTVNAAARGCDRDPPAATSGGRRSRHCRRAPDASLPRRPCRPKRSSARSAMRPTAPAPSSADVGQHQMWVAKAVSVTAAPTRTSRRGGLGTMGVSRFPARDGRARRRRPGEPRCGPSRATAAFR